MQSPLTTLCFSFVLVLVAASTSGQVIDYTHSKVLRGVPGVQDGVVQYHAQANEYGRKVLLHTIANTPPGSHLLIDWEPWLNRLGPEHPWYGDADEEENLRMMGKYAWLIRQVTPALKERQIAIGIYSVPSLMPRNWAKVRRQPREDDPIFQSWLANQEKLLEQAEKSDLLPALRDCGGHVQVVGYTPAAWNGSQPWHATAVGRAIENQSAVLEKHKVPYRWLFRVGHPSIMEAMAEKAPGRSDWWEDRDLPERFEALRAIVQSNAKMQK